MNKRAKRTRVEVFVSAVIGETYTPQPVYKQNLIELLSETIDGLHEYEPSFLRIIDLKWRTMNVYVPDLERKMDYKSATTILDALHTFELGPY